jgi:hypothetical protein
MRFTVFNQYAKGLVHHDQKRGELQHTLERLKWSLWHGTLSKALGKIDDTELLIDNVEEAYPKFKQLAKAMEELRTYVRREAW